MAVVRPLLRPSAQRDRVTGWVGAAVGGAHFEVEHALELARANQLPEWLQSELAIALLDIESVLQRLAQ